MVSIYSITHFLVDFACAFLMFRNIAGTPDGYLCVLLYNFCAFAMQMPIGLLADKLNRNYLVADAGCALVALAFGFAQIPVFATVVMGLGNAFFHIGGGIDVLNISEKRLGALGLFVSPGAFGVYFGTMLGKSGEFPSLFLPLVLLVAAVLIIAVYRNQKGTYPENAEFSLKGINSGRALTVIACLFLVVCVRSFVGLAMNFPWKSAGYWGTALICAVVFGKTIGGFAVDRLGLKWMAIISLGLAALLFLLPEIPAVGVAAVLLFNMTMPVTLWALAKTLRGAKGFSFGILTFGLFLGFLPVYLGVNVPAIYSWGYALLAAVSLLFLVAGLWMAGFHGKGPQSIDLQRAELRKAGQMRSKL